MNRLTELVLMHRRWVALFWLVIAVAGGLNATRTVDRLSFDFALPGQPAYETNLAIAEQFGGGGGLNDPLLLVVRGPAAQGTADAMAGQVRDALPGTRTVTGSEAGASVLTSEDGQTSTAVVYPPAVPGADPYARATPAVEGIVEKAAAQASAADTEVQLTGFLPLSEGGGGGDDRGILVEVAFGVAGALVVLALVFGSLLAGVPLLVAAVSILGTYLALLGLTYVTDVSFVVQFLTALIGLGVAIDYSLLIVTRWREERSAGADNDEAVRTAMRTAGRSVLFSGITVAVSLAALVLVPLPFLRSIGLGGLLIPLLSVATSLTLVPALLSAVGPRLSWPRRGATLRPSRFWTGLASAVVRRRWPVIVASTLLLLALAVPVLGITLGSPPVDGLGRESPSGKALAGAVDAGLPEGVVRPTEVIVPEAKVETALGRLSGVDGVAAAVAPTGEGWRADGAALVQVWSSADPATDAGRASLTGVRQVATGDASVGGSPAEDADFVTAVYGDAIWVVLAVVLVTLLLLARALRSLWLPVKALVLNVLSIAAAYGVSVLVWQDGYGSELIFGEQATGTITIWVPIAAFAFLFGLSMDYEVFILSRMREAYDEHGDTRRAVVDGIAHTGRLVTSAALILFLAFVALSTVPTVEVKILATTLALGILIDAVVVRSLLAPALVAVLGRANWTMPRPLGRLLRIPPDLPGQHRA